MSTSSKHNHNPGILISAANSNSGKTITSCIILRALKKLGVKTCAYKTGPDYLDTKYLRFFGDCDVYNLDSWLIGEKSVKELFTQTSRDCDVAIIEGAMGLYDGGKFSSAEIAKLLNVPVILVLNVKSIGESAAAMALGFKNYDEYINRNFAGVILNCIGSESHAKIISNELAKHGVKILGIIKRDENLKFPDRHLGLIPINELENIAKPDALENFAGNINLDAIIQIANSNPKIKTQTQISRAISASEISLAIAYDEAFSFYYSESLEALKNSGINLKFFSPIHDTKIPDANGYLFGGGYPEIYAAKLQKNSEIRAQILNAANSGKIILAECGGLMYLCESITNLDGKKFEMCGVIPDDCVMTNRPVIGYIEAKALRENILCKKNELIHAHEFHFSKLINKHVENAFELKRRSTGSTWLGGYSTKNILASYMHINFWGNKTLLRNLIDSLRNA